MENKFIDIIRKNSDFSPLYRIVNGYIESKYSFLRPIYYDTYMVFGDELNNQPIIATSDIAHKRFIVINRYNNQNFVALPSNVYNVANFIDGIMRQYKHNKSFSKLELGYVLSDNKKVINKSFHIGNVAKYAGRDRKFVKTNPNKRGYKRVVSHSKKVSAD